MAPPPRTGPQPRLANREFRESLLLLAASGCSRKGVAHRHGMRTAQLTDWLARGLAEVDVEPYASFANAYLAAERLLEPGLTQGLAMQVAHVLRKPPSERTPAEVQFLRSELASRYPIEHGNAASGTGQLRVVDPEPDPDAWWQRQGLTLDQLRALVREPPELVARALELEGYTRQMR